MQWLLASLVLSVVLTIVLNVFVRGFPGVTDRATRRLDDWASRPTSDERPVRVRVFFPWKAMLVGSIVLTVLVNLFARR